VNNQAQLRSNLVMDGTDQQGLLDLQKSTAQVREILLELRRRLVDKGIVKDGKEIFYLNEVEL
jgi:hypothetical protein